MAIQNRAAITWTMPCRTAQPQIPSEEEDTAGMSLYTVVRHPRVHARRRHRPPQVDDEHIGFNGKVAAWITAQDSALEGCIELGIEEQQTLATAAERFEEPPKTEDEFAGFNGRLAAWITNKIGTMTAFYIATIVQFGWMGLAQAGVIRFDTFPFPFLLFMSSLAQLLLMFVVMVGQTVLGRAADARALQTYLDAEAVLHACERLQTHLKAQDLAIRHIVEHMDECRPRPAAGQAS